MDQESNLSYTDLKKINSLALLSIIRIRGRLNTVKTCVLHVMTVHLTAFKRGWFSFVTVKENEGERERERKGEGREKKGRMAEERYQPV